MKIIPVNEIPKDVQDVPLDDPMSVYKTFLRMEHVCSILNGVGLSAVQVGIPWKMFITPRPDEGESIQQKFDWYVNCDYEPVDWNFNVAKNRSLEGCLSIKKENGELRRFFVERYPKVKVKGKKLIADASKPIFKDVDFVPESEIAAVIFQHEIDHQKGILISDIGKEIDIFPI